MVCVCALWCLYQDASASYLGFSYLGRGVSLHGCSSKAQPLLLTLDEGFLLTAALPDLQRGQQPRVPDWDGAGTAERSYPTSEVRGSGQEELPHPPKPEARGSGREGNYKPGEKTTLRMGENNSQWNNWQRINFQNIKAAHTTQFQENKQPNQKVGKWPKRIFLQRRHTDG